MYYVSLGEFLFERPPGLCDMAYQKTYLLKLAEMARAAAAKFVATRGIFGEIAELGDWEPVVASMLEAEPLSRATASECISLLASTSRVAWTI